MYEVLIEFDVNICDVLKMYKSYALITININRLNCNGFVTNKGINFMEMKMFNAWNEFSHPDNNRYCRFNNNSRALDGYFRWQYCSRNDLISYSFISKDFVVFRRMLQVSF